jgi:hypothetical protein
MIKSEFDFGGRDQRFVTKGNCYEYQEGFNVDCERGNQFFEPNRNRIVLSFEIFEFSKLVFFGKIGIVFHARNEQARCSMCRLEC